MPTETSFVLNESHEKLTGDFLDLFNGLQVPDRMALISFLEQHELGCFVKKDAALKLITKHEANITRQQIFCLPVGENVSDDFIKNLSLFFQQEHCPVMLYWTWELPENKGYVALRIKLEKRNNTIQCQTEILNPGGSHCAHIPIRQMMIKLTTHLTDYRVFSVDSPDYDAPVIGDDLYWTALSLFLKLAQEHSEYRDNFIIWQKKNKSIFLHMKERVLDIVPYVHPNLFYAEQGIAIYNMDLVRNFTDTLIPSGINDIPLIASLRNLTDRFPEEVRKNITLVNALRILALGYILYKPLRIFVLGNILHNQDDNAPNEQDYSAPISLVLISGLNYLTTRARQKVQNGIASFFLFYLCSLFSIACQFAFSLYMAMPDNLIQRDITAPRYILQWFSETIKESVKLPIRLICMFMFIKFLRRQIMNTTNNQSGFRAIAFFATQIFMSFFEKDLFQFDHWIFPQNAEAKILFFMKGKCKEPCQFEIKSARIWRALQHAFFDEQTIGVEVSNPGALIKSCEIKISRNHTCADYQLDCRSRLFPGCSGNDSSSLTQVLTTQIYPTQKFSYCL